MKTIIGTIFIAGVALISLGWGADFIMMARGIPGDERSVCAYPMLIGLIAIVFDVALIIGWGVWRLFIT